MSSRIVYARSLYETNKQVDSTALVKDAEEERPVEHDVCSRIRYGYPPYNHSCRRRGFYPIYTKGDDGLVYHFRNYQPGVGQRA